MDLLSSSESLIDDLLEDYWYYENLLTRRSRVLRYCHSDPYPSSSSLTSPEKMGKDLDERKSLQASTGPCLIRAASIDARKGERKTRVQEPRPVGSFLRDKESFVLSKSGSLSAPGKSHCLVRAPSLPPRIEKRKMDHEAKKMISKLTRQFSEKIRVLEPTTTCEYRFLHKKKGNSERNRTQGGSSSVNNTLQRTQTMPNNMIREQEDELEDQETDSRMGFLIREALASSQNIPKVSNNQRQRPPRHLRSVETDMVKQGSSSPKTLRKTVSSIETTKEIQRLKGYDDEPHGLATPPRVPKDSRKEMKDQIKFWARAVASNVRQEC